MARILNILLIRSQNWSRLEIELREHSSPAAGIGADSEQVNMVYLHFCSTADLGLASIFD